MSSAADDQGQTAKGTGLLPRDLTAEELRAAPVLASPDALLIDGLSADEDDAFEAAVGS